MFIFVIIFVAIACIAPMWLIFEIESQVEYDDDGYYEQKYEKKRN